MSFLLRLVVEDRPGMLGAVATALGLAGGDIISLDIVERGRGIAVDDVVVELPTGGLPDRLLTAAESVDGVMVESIRPFTGALDTHRELDLIESMTGEAKTAMQAFAESAPRIFRSGWSVVVDEHGRQVVASGSAPEIADIELPWLPLKRGEILETDAEWVPRGWRELGTALMATPVGGDGRVILLGRPGGPDFRPSELARLSHLAGITATIMNG